jgi:hypothetical protein
VRLLERMRCFGTVDVVGRRAMCRRRHRDAAGAPAVRSCWSPRRHGPTFCRLTP